MSEASATFEIPTIVERDRLRALLGELDATQTDRDRLVAAVVALDLGFVDEALRRIKVLPLKLKGTPVGKRLVKSINVLRPARTAPR